MSETEEDRTENPLTLMVVPLDGAGSPTSMAEGTLGGDTTDSGEEDAQDSPRVQPVPDDTCRRATVDTRTPSAPDVDEMRLQAARMDQQRRRANAGPAAGGPSPANLGPLVGIAMEAAELCGRDGPERKRLATELVLAFVEELPPQTRLTDTGLIQSLFAVIAAASKNGLSINTPPPRTFWGRTSKWACCARDWIVDLARSRLSKRKNLS